MKKPCQNLDHTLAARFFTLLPVLILLVMLGQMFAAAKSAISPVMGILFASFKLNPHVIRLVAAAAVALLPLFVGALTRTRFGQSCGRWIEAKLLKPLPMYELVSKIPHMVSGNEKGEESPVALVKTGERSQFLGLIAGRLKDGRDVVFLPSAPNLPVRFMFSSPRKSSGSTRRPRPSFPACAMGATAWRN